MVGRDIRHNTYVTVIETETRSNDAAARGLEYGNVDGRVFQYELSRNRTGVIAADDLLVLNICTVGSCEADRTSASLQNVCDQAGRGRLSVCSGDGNYRNSRRRAAREEHVDYMFGDVSADTLARCEMHPKAGCRIYFDYPAAVFGQRFGDVRRDDVNAGHVEPDD